MLIYDQMEFHNVTALVEKPGLPGLVMQRFPVLAMALYPWHVVMERDNAYARKLHEVIAGLNLPNLHEVDGWDLLPDCTGLSADGLHPSDWGHMVIAQNLARTIQRIMN